MAVNKYKNAKIYRLVNNVDGLEYIGSTTSTLVKRKCEHKSCAKNKADRRVYKHLNKVGWDNVEIVLVKNYACNNKEELNAEERRVIDEMKPELNKVLPTRTDLEWREANKVKIAEKKREYNQANKEKLAETKREYETKNKDKIAEKKREYNQANKEKIAEYQKEYQQEYNKANREAINTRRRKKYASKKAQQTSY